MRLACLNRLAALGVVSGALACGGNGGGTTPPGPPVDLLKTPAGDNQSWYFNNPLPTALSVTAVDVDGRAVPGVVITWAVTTGDGAVTPTQSTTKNTGVASTTDSVGSATLQRVSATFSMYSAVRRSPSARLGASSIAASKDGVHRSTNRRTTASNSISLPVKR